MDFLGAGICPTLEPSLATGNGIEAFDVGSLLEQFEEASQSSEESVHVTLPSANLPRNDKLLEKTVKPVNNVTPEKPRGIKFGVKRKGAILLPLGVPSNRGRGKAQAISPYHSSSKLQKILLKNNTETNNNNRPVPLASNGIPALNNNVPALNNKVDIQSCGNSGTVSPADSSTKEQLSEEVSSTYYSEIIDHDYCQNFPASLSPPSREPSCLDLSEIPQEVLQLHDPASTQFDQTVTEDPKPLKTTSQLTSIKKKITAKEYKHRYRNYRRKEDSSITPLTVNGKFFDKIPSYFTTLSLPSKPPKKGTKVLPSGGIKVADIIQRDISPSLSNSSDVYNKLPAYHNCFINSTKYDDSPAASSVSEIENLSLKSTKYPWDRLRDRINRDNSRSNSPLMMLDTRCESKSREMSCSPRHSRSPSRSPLPRRYRLSCSSGSSCSSSYSRSRSRSFERSRKRRRRQRERGHSYSSYSSRSSDSDWDSSSRSRSRSYSRSQSRGRTHSRSPIRKSRSRRNSSYERRRAERDQLREEEKKRQIEERRIVYVGKIPETYTRRQLRARFDKFGEIEETSVHFRETGDNYGFVTFSYTCDAYAAIEHGNKVAGDQRFDLCFGGRREFCAVDYADLDGQVEEEEESCFISQKPALSDFDQLLKAAKQKLSK